MTRSMRLTGLDLAPLPYESSLSILWRLGWRNKLKASILKKICGGTKGYPAHGLLFARDWIDREQFHHQTGWILPTREELAFCSSLRQKEDGWVDRYLRYCPVCLGDGYHSFWHQCTGFELCPIHKLPLSTRCHQCDARLPELRFGNALLDHSYICPKCQLPISGVPVSLEAHLHLREQQDLLVRSLNSYNKWWEESRGARKRVAELVGDQWSAIYKLRTWCNSTVLMRDMAYFDCPPPPEFHPPIYRHFTRLSWRIRLYESPEPWRINKRRDWHQRTHVAIAVYRCTLRRLIGWIQREDSPTSEEVRRHSWLDIEKNKVNISGYNPKLVALYLMRTMLEHWKSFAKIDLFK